MKENAIHGLMAEFTEPDSVLSAAKKIHEAGFSAVDAYSPFPIDGLPEQLGFSCEIIGWITFTFAFIGLVVAFLLQYYCSVIAYPMNIGGRPLNSWPSFIPVCFELAILFASLGAVFSLFFLNQLPKPYHPVFNSLEFSLATKNRFFIVIEKDDPLFEFQKTRDFLMSLNPIQVIEVLK